MIGSRYGERPAGAVWCLVGRSGQVPSRAIAAMHQRGLGFSRRVEDFWFVGFVICENDNRKVDK